MRVIDYARYRGFDLVGDVHGCADQLEQLLDRLGYTRRAGVWQYHDQRHPRLLIFLGDLIDRGPRIRETLLQAIEMVEAGHAQMLLGNHELNALGYHTPAPADWPQRWLYAHTARHTRMLGETLEQFAAHTGDWKSALSWLHQRPLYLRLPGARAVHACWDHQVIEMLDERLPQGYLRPEELVEVFRPQSELGQQVDRLTRGVVLRLPEGASMTSPDGFVRRGFRARFWGEPARTYQALAFQPDPLPPAIADRPLPSSIRQRLCHYGAGEVPLFIGHYWLNGKPAPLAPNLACLDYSAVNHGYLVAYRFDGEAVLSPKHFAWVTGAPLPGTADDEDDDELVAGD